METRNKEKETTGGVRGSSSRGLRDVDA